MYNTLKLLLEAVMSTLNLGKEETKMKLPDFKKGDKGILKSSANGQLKVREGQIFTVQSRHENGGYYKVKFEGSQAVYNIYSGTRGDNPDDYCMATREAQAEYLKKTVQEMKAQIVEAEKEIEWLEKYSSDEEATADKLAQILKNPTKENIQKVLEEMRSSNFL